MKFSRLAALAVLSLASVAASATNITGEAVGANSFSAGTQSDFVLGGMLNSTPDVFTITLGQGEYSLDFARFTDFGGAISSLTYQGSSTSIPASTGVFTYDYENGAKTPFEVGAGGETLTFTLTGTGLGVGMVGVTTDRLGAAVVATSPVPEPASAVLMIAGLGGLVFLTKRRKQA